MNRLIRLFSIIAIFIILFISILPFSFASQVNGVVYTSLPEPIPTENTKFLVVTDTSGVKAPLIFMFSSSVFSDFYITYTPSLQDIKLDIYYTGNASPQYMHMCIFNLLNGTYVGFSSFSVSLLYQYRNTSLNGYNSFISFGVDVINSNGARTALVEWNKDIEWNIYNLLSNSLSAIQSDLFNIDFNSESILRDLRSYVSWVENTFYPYFTTQTTNIINRLDTIISLLGGEYSSSEIDLPEDQQSDINELASAEDVIRGDIQGGMNSAFSDYGQVFTGNGAFALIKNGIESIILSNSKLNALIIFALTLGIAIMLIGRRIQA